MKPNKELVGATTGMLVLAALAKAPTYGYDLVRRINDEAQGLFVCLEGTVYPILYRLEKEGLVHAEWREAAAGRRRKYYHLTAKGRDALAAQAEQWHAFHHMVARAVDAAAECAPPHDE